MLDKHLMHLFTFLDSNFIEGCMYGKGTKYLRFECQKSTPNWYDPIDSIRGKRKPILNRIIAKISDAKHSFSNAVREERKAVKQLNIGSIRLSKLDFFKGKSLLDNTPILVGYGDTDISKESPKDLFLFWHDTTTGQLDILFIENALGMQTDFYNWEGLQDTIQELRAKQVCEIDPIKVKTQKVA